MSIFSDYACGALSDVEFHNACVEMNAQDRWEREHEYDIPTCENARLECGEDEEEDYICEKHGYYCCADYRCAEYEPRKGENG